MEVGGSSIVNSVITAAGDRVSWNPPTPKRTFKLEFTEGEFKHLCDITSNWYSRHGTTIKEKLAAARDKE